MAVASFKAAKVRLEIAAVLGLIAVAGVALFGPRAPLASGPIIVNTTADPGSAGVCALRDAITAANTLVAVNGCAAGTGTDTINFIVSGTITIGSTLPAIANAFPGSLTIDGTEQSITVNGASLYGVLVVNTGATLNLNNLTIANATDFSGGAIFSEGTLTVTNSAFSDNSGGAIVSGETVSVTNSTFSGNSAGNGGGAIYNGCYGKLNVTGSTFSDNSASGGGGAIVNGCKGTLNVTNSTFSGNSASGGGGGAILNDSTLTVTNSTFSDNSAASGGGGIYNSEGTVTVINSILATDTGGNCSGTIIDGGYNISDDDTCSFTGTNVTTGQTIGDNVNPLLATAGLQNNGGPTQTIALQPNSPAIDAVPIAHQCPATDQRGDPRPDPEGSATACDVGAFESTLTPAPVAATITISPKTLAFGKHRVGSTIEKFVKVSAKKPNRSPVLIEEISVSGGDYAWDAPLSSCVPGHLLAAGQSCSIAIKFTPPAVTKGESDTGQLIVTTDAEIVKPSGGRIALKGGGK